MVNLEHKLTVDDLIVEYMIYKVKNGYEPSFLTSEFLSFLYFFESKMKVEDCLYENEKLFRRFLERKNENDWGGSKYLRDSKVTPHMDMIYSEKDDDYLICANYRLSIFDLSVINTYFMDKGMGKYGKGTVAKIREIIKEYVETLPKRTLDEAISVDENEMTVGKYIAAEIISQIWDSSIDKKIECHEWPRQCKDMEKYLFETDLAPLINLPSMREELLDLYHVMAKRVAILFHQDRNLKISSSSSQGYLAHANYELLIQGNESVMNTYFGPYRKSFEVDLSIHTFKETHALDGVYEWDDEIDTKTTTTTVGNEKTKRIVKLIDSFTENK